MYCHAGIPIRYLEEIARHGSQPYLSHLVPETLTVLDKKCKNWLGVGLASGTDYATRIEACREVGGRMRWQEIQLWS